MTARKARFILAFVVLVLLFSILPLLYWDFVRDTVIIPFYYIIWLLSLILNAIPQGIYLALLVLLSLIIGFKTLDSVHIEQRFHRRERNHQQTGTQYLHWRSLYTNLYLSPFSRNRFAWEARKLILSILAYEHGISSLEAETLVRNGTLTVPETIKNLIESKTFPDARFPNRFTKRLLRLRQLFFKTDSKKDPQVDSLIAEIISFIEYRLEINHAGNQPKP